MPKPQIEIRKAQPQDNHAARRIVANSLGEFGIAVDFAVLDRAVGQIGLPDSGNLLELVAVATEDICGCIVLEAAHAGCPKIVGFHLAPTQRGQGIGRALLKACMAEGKAMGLQTLQLDTWDHMQAAVRLYESLGWQRDEDPPPESGANRSYRFEF